MFYVVERGNSVIVTSEWNPADTNGWKRIASFESLHVANATAIKREDKIRATAIYNQTIRLFPATQGRSWYGRCTECSNWIRGLQPLKRHIERSHAPGRIY